MAIAFVNSASGYAGGAGTSIASGAQNHTAGNLLVVCIGFWEHATGTVSSIADTAGNTYIQAVSGTRLNLANQYGMSEVWYARNILGNASNVITVTFTNSQTFRVVVVHQYSGAHLTDPLDVTGGGFSNTGQTTFTQTGVARNHNDEVIVGWFNMFDLGVCTAGSGFTLRNDLIYSGSEDGLFGAKGTDNVVMTYSTSQPWTGSFATFRRAPELKTWDGGGADDNWATHNNWNANVAPNADDSLAFAGTTRLTPNNNYTAATNFTSMTFNTGAGAFVIGGNQITISSSAGVVNNDNSLQTINLAIITNTANTIVNRASGNIAFGGVVSGTGGLQFSGANQVSLTALNTYTGKTIFVQGTIEVNTIKSVSEGSSSLGAPVTAGNGTIEVQGFDPILKYIGTGNVSNRIFDFNAGAGKTLTVEQAGTGTLEFTSTPTGLASTKTLILRGSTAGIGRWSGVLANFSGNALTIQKDGTGRWLLSAVNTFTGPQNVNGGEYGTEGAGSTTSGSVVTVASGASLIGTGNILGNVTFNNGGISKPGIDSVTGYTLAGNVVFNSTSIMDFTIGSPSDSIDSVVNLTLDGIINVTAGAGFVAGTYIIILYSGTLTNNTLTVGALPVGYSAIVATNATQVLLVVSNAFGNEKQEFGQNRGQEVGQN